MDAILDSDHLSPTIPALKMAGSRSMDISATSETTVASLTPLDTRIGKKWTVMADFMMSRHPIPKAIRQ